jgi:hypothetical protein
MKYMLLMSYGDAPGVPPMSEWRPRTRGHAARR